MGLYQPTTAVAARLAEDVSGQQAYLALARRLLQLNQPICGLWPVATEMVFEDVPRHLAAALASLGTTAGIVDRPDRWSDGVATSLLTEDLGEGIDLLKPTWERRLDLGSAVEHILALIAGRYARVLLDLSGLDLVGAQEVAMAPGVGIVLLVARGRASEFDLARLRRRLPLDRVVGVVLVDADRPRGFARS
jgi:hypothetical protein